MKNGFTLIELMVVFGIIALTLGLSIFGLSRFRANVELNSAYTNIISLINEGRNKSTNAFGSSTGGTLQQKDLFGINFLNTSVQPIECTSNSDGSVFSCLNSSSGLITLSNMEITVIGCATRFGFKRLTQDFIALDSVGNVQASGNCTVDIRHLFTNEVKTITINLVENTYK